MRKYILYLLFIFINLFGPVYNGAIHCNFCEVVEKGKGVKPEYKTCIDDKDTMHAWYAKYEIFTEKVSSCEMFKSVQFNPTDFLGPKGSAEHEDEPATTVAEVTTVTEALTTAAAATTVAKDVTKAAVAATTAAAEVTTKAAARRAAKDIPDGKYECVTLYITNKLKQSKHVLRYCDYINKGCDEANLKEYFPDEEFSVDNCKACSDAHRCNAPEFEFLLVTESQKKEQIKRDKDEDYGTVHDKEFKDKPSVLDNTSRLCLDKFLIIVTILSLFFH